MWNGQKKYFSTNRSSYTVSRSNTPKKDAGTISTTFKSFWTWLLRMAGFKTKTSHTPASASRNLNSISSSMSELAALNLEQKNFDDLMDYYRTVETYYPLAKSGDIHCCYTIEQLDQILIFTRQELFNRIPTTFLLELNQTLADNHINSLTTIK